MDKEITFDLEKFLNEDCKEENEIGIKMTFSILRKAFEKGLQNSALYCYEKGMKDAKTEFIAMLTEIQLEIEEIDSRAGYDGNGMPTFANDYVRIKKVNEIIQEKINALKGEENVDKT